MPLFGRRSQQAFAFLAGLMFCAVCHVPVGAQTSAPAGTMPEDYLPGLKTVLESAVRQSPQMILQQLEVDRSEDRVMIADAERLPQVGGNIRYVANKTAATNAATSKDSGLFYALSANQAVFRWGEIKNRRHSARISVAIAEKNFAEAYRILATQLRQAYLQLVARQAQLRSARFALALQQGELATARERLATGATSAVEITGRELGIAETELAIEREETEFEHERRRLSRLAGLAKPLAADEIPAEVPPLRTDRAVTDELLAGILRDGAKSSFRAQVAEMRVKQADLNYRIARVRLLPKFGLGIGHSRESSTTASATQVSQTAITRDSVELRGEWSIFDGFATRGIKRETLAEKRSYERQRDNELNATLEDAQHMARLVSINARALKFAEQRQAGAVTIVAVAEEDMKKAGVASQRTLDAALQGLRDAEAGTTAARASYLSQWSEFVSLVSADPILSNLPPRYARP